VQDRQTQRDITEMMTLIVTIANNVVLTRVMLHMVYKIIVEVLMTRDLLMLLPIACLLQILLPRRHLLRMLFL